MTRRSIERLVIGDCATELAIVDRRLTRDRVIRRSGDSESDGDRAIGRTLAIGDPKPMVNR